MAVKFVAFFALIAVVAAAPQHYYEQPSYIKSYEPAVVKQVVKKIVEHEEPANYDFAYAVHDDHTGDIKEQHESAKNGAIEGYYTLIDADGYKRIVHYTADHEHGFNAEVKREPIEGHTIVKTVQPVVVKKIVAQPVQKYIAPVAQYYAAPTPVIEKHYTPVVQKYVAAPVKVEKYAKDSDAYTHVSFSGPSSSYHY